MTRARPEYDTRRALGVAACLLSLTCGAAPAASPAEDFLYHAVPRDTLIGIGRRLLLDPTRWPELQRRNAIADPRHIPLGKILRIPYDWLKLTDESATVVSLAGDVDLGGRKPAIGDLLPQGSVIRTGADGSVTIDLADGSVVTLQKSSSLKLDQMVQVTGVSSARSIVLKLDSGRLETTVKPHRDVGRFEIITPVAVSAVRGTQFRDSFTADDAHGTTETLQGTVGVGNAAATVAVAAGFGTRIEPGRDPIAPVALLPAPDLSDVPPRNGGAVLALHWPAVAGARQYRVQLAADSLFQALTADRVTAEPTLELPAPADGNYWLRARSIDGLGIEGSDAVTTIGQHLLPAPPRPTSPPADAKIVGDQIHLAWASDPGASTYALQVATDASFGAPVVERRQLTLPSADLEPLSAGVYFWRARAANAQGEEGPWSSVRSFVRRPTLDMPDVTLERHWVTLRWRPQAGETYRLQVAHDPGFSHALVDRRTDAPQWSIPAPFPGIYYCRVQSIDAAGNDGGFSAPRRFVVPIPLWVKVAAPLAVGLAFLL